MTVTPEAASHLAEVACAIRADQGLSTWDRRGVVAAIRKVADRQLPDVAMAVIRAAANPESRTPGVIPKLDGIHWEERITDPEKPPRLAREDTCRACGKHRLDGVHKPLSLDDYLSGAHVWEPLDGPRTIAQLNADTRAELREILRYAGRVPDPDEAEPLPNDEETP